MPSGIVVPGARRAGPAPGRIGLAESRFQMACRLDRQPRCLVAGRRLAATLGEVAVGHAVDVERAGEAGTRATPRPAATSRTTVRIIGPAARCGGGHWRGSGRWPCACSGSRRSRSLAKSSGLRGRPNPAGRCSLGTTAHRASRCTTRESRDAESKGGRARSKPRSSPSTWAEVTRSWRITSTPGSAVTAGAAAGRARRWPTPR